MCISLQHLNNNNYRFCVVHNKTLASAYNTHKFGFKKKVSGQTACLNVTMCTVFVGLH